MLKKDVYGDSDTAAYSVDGSNDHPLKCLQQLGEPFENFLHGSELLSQGAHSLSWCLITLLTSLSEWSSVSGSLSVLLTTRCPAHRNAVGLGTPTLSTKPMPQILHKTFRWLYMRLWAQKVNHNSVCMFHESSGVLHKWLVIHGHYRPGFGRWRWLQLRVWSIVRIRSVRRVQPMSPRESEVSTRNSWNCR